MFKQKKLVRKLVFKLIQVIVCFALLLLFRSSRSRQCPSVFLKQYFKRTSTKEKIIRRLQNDFFKKEKLKVDLLYF